MENWAADTHPTGTMVNWIELWFHIKYCMVKKKNASELQYGSLLGLPHASDPYLVDHPTYKFIPGFTRPIPLNKHEWDDRSNRPEAGLITPLDAWCWQSVEDLVLLAV